MNYYNNSYIQKRGAERNYKIVGKDIAESEHYKEVRAAINECANRIAERFGLSNNTSKNIASLISNDRDMGAELYKRIFFVIDILKKYGYTEEEAANIIDDNFTLVQQSPVRLIHSLAIANQYNLDEEFLINNRNCANVNENELYALIENLKASGNEVTIDKIYKLNSQVKRNKSMSNLVSIYPLSHSKIMVYRTLYDRKLKEMEQEKTLVKIK